MADRIIYFSLALLAILAIVSFFHDPSYEKGVWLAIGAVSNVLSAACGAKFGAYVPRGDDDRR